uniref:26S proteasome non-ATPase regulatory subunit 9 n=1 Tax=Zonotrichia albicollis TaxID=44394 RepID=A0A8D2NED6_ZONAL
GSGVPTAQGAAGQGSGDLSSSSVGYPTRTRWQSQAGASGKYSQLGQQGVLEEGWVSPLGEASPTPCVLMVSPTGLQNDHKAVMKQVEEALHKLHAREKEKHARDEAEALAEAMSQSQSLPQAFAKVNSVSPGSPASVSGLQVDDEIVEFGSVNANNFQNLQNIATVVQHSEGRPLSVTVIRGGRRVHVGLTPKRWAGKGLLGCNIIPLQR